jgi:hypothetical protein
MKISNEPVIDSNGVYLHDRFIARSYIGDKSNNQIYKLGYDYEGVYFDYTDMVMDYDED